ncbi:esterase-like activity of phytase family protein [uncultured Shimia sp.]|uniref:esterase-like activity of phytase family protein n=1 Tax=uncultured Shimia sp. TaxID=573152 RepID=UPI002631052E|nr:esterase-like activity of phytase family protein [uncultured Shimia sp.]
MRRSFAIAVAACVLSVGVLASRSNSGASDDLAEHVSTYIWRLHDGWFGGFSGIELSDNGREMVAISDRGMFVTGTLRRKDGAVSSVVGVESFRVLDTKGTFPQKAGLRDSEGLVLQKDGKLVVSFEGKHRLNRFSQPGAKAQGMPWRKTFNQMKVNGGFEALAINNWGKIFAIPEQPISDETIAQVFTLKKGQWEKAFTLPREKQFQPVGADFGPDGRLYLLERGFNGLGFRVRVRSFAVEGTVASDEKLLLRKGIGIHDNLEGLAVWRDELGRIRLTMISDDNFRLIQRTEIVEYVIPQ